MKKRILISARVIVPFSLILLGLLFLTTIFLENHSGSIFYNGVNRGANNSYLPDSWGNWDQNVGNWASSNSIANVFYRFAFNFHANIIYMIQQIFGTQTASNLARLGSINYDLLIGGFASILFIVAITVVLLPIWVGHRKVWHVLSIVVNSFIWAILLAFLIWGAIHNNSIRNAIKGTEPHSYPFYVLVIPYFNWIPIGLAIILTTGIALHCIYAGVMNKGASANSALRKAKLNTAKMKKDRIKAEKIKSADLKASLKEAKKDVQTEPPSQDKKKS